MNRRMLRTGIAAILLIVMFAATVMPVYAASYYNYDRPKAVKYAIENGRNGVPGSWYFGGIFQADCTNFASNVLKVGGIPMFGKQYTSQYQWYFYDGYPKPSYSYSWSAAKNFGIWLTTTGIGKKVSMANKPWSNYMRPGDIVQIDEDGDGFGDHTMIVTRTDGSDLYMTYHSNDNVDKPLTKVLSESKLMYPKSTLIGYNIVD